MCDGTRAVLFDLDGTLVQTRIASWEVFRPISERYRLGVTDPEQFYRLFEHNMFKALRMLCRGEEEAAEVEAAFLRGLREDYAPTMIPGMADVVRTLASHCTLAVLTSNVTAVVRRILLANDIAYCFAHVFGGDVEPDKEHGIRRFLADAAHGCGRHCAVSYDEVGRHQGCSSPREVVLVTDTVSDVKVAVAVGIRAVGVAWGMHSETELTDAGAEFVAIWPQELLAHLLPGPAAPVICAVPPSGKNASLSGQSRAVGDDGRAADDSPFSHFSSVAAVPKASPGGVAAASGSTGKTEQARAARIRRERRTNPPGRRMPASALPRGVGFHQWTDDQLRRAVRRILPR